MSASLVGSEMCIRDSSMATSTPSPTSSWARWPLSLAAPPRTRCWRTVSYTHLTLPTICSV
eukprot:10405136-Alexandrium_andersonii.AAC.1